MVKDAKTGICHRADKLIEDHIDKVLAKGKNLKPEEREKLIRIQADAGAYKEP
jgi:glycyl-tRNA synthetase (class II)